MKLSDPSIEDTIAVATIQTAYSETRAIVKRTKFLSVVQILAILYENSTSPVGCEGDGPITTEFKLHPDRLYLIDVSTVQPASRELLEQYFVDLL